MNYYSYLLAKSKSRGGAPEKVMPVYGELPRFNQRVSNIKVENFTPKVGIEIVRHYDNNTTVSHRYLVINGYGLMGCLFSDNTWYFLYGHSLFTSPVNINCSHVLSTPNVL